MILLFVSPPPCDGVRRRSGVAMVGDFVKQDPRFEKLCLCHTHNAFLLALFGHTLVCSVRASDIAFLMVCASSICIAVLAAAAGVIFPTALASRPLRLNLPRIENTFMRVRRQQKRGSKYAPLLSELQGLRCVGSERRQGGVRKLTYYWIR